MTKYSGKNFKCKTNVLSDTSYKEGAVITFKRVYFKWICLDSDLCSWEGSLFILKYNVIAYL